MPALIFLGLPFPVAPVALSLRASLRHLKQISFEALRLVLSLATGLPGVVLGALLVIKIPPQPGETALGPLTIALGWYSWRRPRLGLSPVTVAGGTTHALVGALGLFIIGILNGSLTSGTDLIASAQ